MRGGGGWAEREHRRAQEGEQTETGGRPGRRRETAGWGYGEGSPRDAHSGASPLGGASALWVSTHLPGAESLRYSQAAGSCSPQAETGGVAGDKIPPPPPGWGVLGEGGGSLGGGPSTEKAPSSPAPPRPSPQATTSSCFMVSSRLSSFSRISWVWVGLREPPPGTPSPSRGGPAPLSSSEGNRSCFRDSTGRGKGTESEAGLGKRPGACRGGGEILRGRWEPGCRWGRGDRKGV